MSADDLGGVRAALSDQARSCRDLGSVLTAQIMETLGTALQADQGAVARRVLDWPGDTSSRGASVPLRLAGALHAQVLLSQAPALAAAYAKGEAPAALLLQTIAAHEAEILAWLNQTPQTNEVGRAAALIAGARFALVQLGTPLPLALRELGASAGLNLNFPDYTIDCHGSSEPPAMLSPDWRGEVPPQIALVAPNRRGVDLHPVDITDPTRLRAYIWPDQPQRLARLDAALAHARTHPPQVDEGDAGAWLDQQRLAHPGLLTLVYHTIAHQYFPPEVQARIARRLSETGRQATADAPLARLAMEADDTPGNAALELDLWDGQHRRWRLGRADFHGRWIDWRPEAI